MYSTHNACMVHLNSMHIWYVCVCGMTVGPKLFGCLNSLFTWCLTRRRFTYTHWHSNRTKVPFKSLISFPLFTRKNRYVVLHVVFWNWYITDIFLTFFARGAYLAVALWKCKESENTDMCSVGRNHFNLQHVIGLDEPMRVPVGRDAGSMMNFHRGLALEGSNLMLKCCER